MTDQFARQAQEIFVAAKNARIPENIQAIVQPPQSEPLILGFSNIVSGTGVRIPSA